MARDYKHRVNQQRKTRDQQTISWWKVLWVVLLIGGFSGFLVFLNGSDPDEKLPEQPSVEATKEVVVEKKTKEPKFTFYKILPETEVFVPSHEVETRNREEKIGKGEPTTYLIQVGSFSEYEKANSLKRDLAMMGIESTIEKIDIDHVVWNRLIIGPYSKSSNVVTLKKRLRESGINTKIIEIK